MISSNLKQFQNLTPKLKKIDNQINSKLITFITRNVN